MRWELCCPKTGQCQEEITVSDLVLFLFNDGTPLKENSSLFTTVIIAIFQSIFSQTTHVPSVPAHPGIYYDGCRGQIFQDKEGWFQNSRKKLFLQLKLEWITQQSGIFNVSFGQDDLFKIM